MVEKLVKDIKKLGNKISSIEKKLKKVMNVKKELLNALKKPFKEIENIIKHILCLIKSIQGIFKQLPKNAKDFGNGFNKFFKKLFKSFKKRIALIFHAIGCVDELFYDFIYIKYTSLLYKFWKNLSFTIKFSLFMFLLIIIYMISLASIPVTLWLVLIPINWPILFTVMGGIFAVFMFIIIYAIARWILRKYYKKENKCKVKYISERSKEIDKITPSFKDFLNAINITKIFEIDFSFKKCDKKNKKNNDNNFALSPMSSPSDEKKITKATVKNIPKLTNAQLLWIKQKYPSPLITNKQFALIKDKKDPKFTNNQLIAIKKKKITQQDMKKLEQILPKKYIKMLKR